MKITDTIVMSNRGNSANFIVLTYNTLGMTTTQLEGVEVSDNKLLGIWGTSPGLVVLEAMFLDSLGTYMQSREGILDLVDIVCSKFSHNSGNSGGSIVFYVHPHNISDVRLVVRDTTFTENIANIGPALSMFHFESLIHSSRIHVYLEDVVASGNTFPGANNSPENVGAFYVSYISNITLVGTEGKGCLFQNNRMSVVTAVATHVVLHGRITFENNSGFRGGALFLIDSSRLFIHNNSVITFTNNTAFQEGGALYINTL